MNTIIFKDGVTTYCFLNQVIVDSNKSIKLYELVVNIEGTDIIDVYSLDLESVKELMRVNTGKNVKYDFKIENGFLRCESVFQNVMTEAMITQQTNTHVRYAPAIKSIYDLFRDLISSNGVYIDSSVEDKIAHNYVGEGIIGFKDIKISKSTMTVGISAKVEKQWITRKLIYIKDGNLVTDKFMFGIPSDKSSVMNDYDLEFVGTYNLLNESYNIYRYTEEIPIYAYSHNNLRIFAPILVRYTYNSECYKTIIDTCSILITEMLKQSIQGPEEVEEKEKIPYKTSKDSKYAIIFTSSIKAPTSVQKYEIINECLGQIVPRVVKGEITLEDVTKDLLRRKMDYLTIYTYLTVIDLFRNTKLLPLDRIEQISDMKETYKAKKLECDLYLYSLRASLYLSEYRLNGFERVILRGSDVPYYATLTKKEGI